MAVMAFRVGSFQHSSQLHCPGYIDTNMTQSTLNKPRKEGGNHPSYPPQPQSGRPDDIAAAVPFLACDCSDAVNGTPGGRCSLYLVETSPRKTQRFGRAGDLAKQVSILLRLAQLRACLMARLGENL